jgi:thiol-disulfide isomerase/thioredoxin
MKKLFLYFFTLFLFLIFSNIANAKADDIKIQFFYGDGCPHCAKEEIFLDKLEASKDNVKIERIEVWYNQKNAKRLQETGQELGVNIGGVPFTVVGDEYVAGFASEDTTGAHILEMIKRQEEKIQAQDLEKKPLPEKIHVPIFGDINLKSLSLPVMTIVIAGFDGFNPCAMWVLIFLISMLLGMKDRKRMWALGLTFLISSAMVYFLFLSAWLNFFLFIGIIIWVRLIIGIVAVGGGIFNIRDWWKNKNGECKVINTPGRKRIMDKIKVIIQEEKFLFALVGIAILAFAVNLIELVCSAGLPAIFTQVLSMSNLPGWQYYLYLFLYIIIFLLDDILVFVIAMMTLKISGSNSKYVRHAGLVGGIILVILGILLVAKPEWLMFG